MLKHFTCNQGERSEDALCLQHLARAWERQQEKGVGDQGGWMELEQGGLGVHQHPQ